MAIALRFPLLTLTIVVAVLLVSAHAQQLLDIKKIPKRINADMCQCALSVKTDEREARHKAAQKFCEAQIGISIPDFETEVQVEVRKPLPRGLAQWTRKQVETEGVDYKCLNQLREFYFFQKKLSTFFDTLEKTVKDDYARCFGIQMKWLNPTTGDLDKVVIRQEIAGSELLNPKLRQSLELLSLTCRGKTIDDLESYIRCATKPCADPEFFELIGKKPTESGP
ncbi:unnamed protein product [Notodromas monacha]|uniref:Uncharacterized protein n=1 Tax=Notodromas monacha TaxID=399045 RepID=A0A7R9BGD5_9CRUS|nr:unnamed protein product [Notodromas monacha]CAG0914986.1 unnamed protein product [Notodromas monacha]